VVLIKLSEIAKRIGVNEINLIAFIHSKIFDFSNKFGVEPDKVFLDQKYRERLLEQCNAHLPASSFEMVGEAEPIEALYMIGNREPVFEHTTPKINYSITKIFGIDIYYGSVGGLELVHWRDCINYKIR
jgi:hypothetical protein